MSLYLPILCHVSHTVSLGYLWSDVGNVGIAFICYICTHSLLWTFDWVLKVPSVSTPSPSRKKDRSACMISTPSNNRSFLFHLRNLHHPHLLKTNNPPKFLMKLLQQIFL